MSKRLNDVTPEQWDSIQGVFEREEGTHVWYNSKGWDQDLTEPDPAVVELAMARKESIHKRSKTELDLKGTKHDQAKLRLDLIPAEGEEGLGEAFTYGVGKYGDHNWRGGIVYSRLIGAIARHLRLFKGGEDRDIESGLYHVDSIAATAMMLSTFLREGSTKLDDRYRSKK